MLKYVCKSSSSYKYPFISQRNKMLLEKTLNFSTGYANRIVQLLPYATNCPIMLQLKKLYNIYFVPGSGYREMNKAWLLLMRANIYWGPQLHEEITNTM